jgi:hypothetical protein
MTTLEMFGAWFIHLKVIEPRPPVMMGLCASGMQHRANASAP